MIDNSAIKPEECDSCSFNTINLKPFKLHRYEGLVKANKDQKTHHWLCNLCAGTFAGNAAEWPAHYMDSGDILKCICYVGNSIIEEIRKNGKNGLK